MTKNKTKTKCLLLPVKKLLYNLKYTQFCSLLPLRSGMGNGKLCKTITFNYLNRTLYKEQLLFCAMIATDKITVNKKMETNQVQTFLFIFKKTENTFKVR